VVWYGEDCVVGVFVFSAEPVSFFEGVLVFVV